MNSFKSSTACHRSKWNRINSIHFDDKHIYKDGELLGEVISQECVDHVWTIKYKTISKNKYLNGTERVIKYKIG